MRPILPAGLACIAAFVLEAQSPGRLGKDLTAGTTLTYAANGEKQPPWQVDSVGPVGAPLARAECTSLFLRRRPEQTSPDESRLCLRSDTLFAWDTSAQSWRAQRPVGARMQISLIRANGDTVHFRTSALGVHRVGPFEFQVIETEVLTVDPKGVPKRRLLERYAVSLATATRGEFQVPDSAGGWRTQQTFELVGVGQ